MSLILDALNRSREDRDAVPGIAAQHGISTERPARWRQGLPWIALGVACLLIAWLLFERGTEDEPVQGLPSASGNDERRQDPPAQSLNREVERAGGANAAISEVQDSQPAPAMAAGTPGASLAADARPVAPAPRVVASATTPSPEIAALYAGEKPGRPSAQTQSRPQAVATQPSSAPINPETAPVAAASRPGKVAAPVADSPAVATAAGSSEDEPIDLEKALQQARVSAADARLVEHPVPFLAALSQQAKDEIPSVFYQRHDYSERSPSVVLNGKTLRVGGAPAAGMKVREILPDSVILEHRGVKFRLRALNSWVNL